MTVQANTETELGDIIDQAHKLLATIRAHGKEAIRRDSGPGTDIDGYPSGGGEGGGRTNGPANPTLSAAAARLATPAQCTRCKPAQNYRCPAHENTHDEVHVCRCLADEHLDRAITALDQAASWYQRSATVGDEARGRRPTIIACHNCGADCIPRARMGRCDACYQARLRNGGTDRLPPIGTPAGDARAKRAAQRTGGVPA